MKKFLFLDIDGVLASDQEWGVLLEDKSCPFNRGALNNLEHILDEVSGVDIIISSSWRKGQCIDELQELFKVRQFKYWEKIIDKTVVLSFEPINGKFVEFYMPMPRGCEIEHYIRSHTDRIDQFKYAILDDGSDMMYWQRDNFIHIRDGLLTEENAKKAIEILK